MQNIALLRPAEEETSALVLRPLLPRLPLSGSRRQSQPNMAVPGRYRGPRSGGFAQTILPRSNITLHSNSPGSPELPKLHAGSQNTKSRTTTMRHSIESESCGETDELQRYRRSADRLEEAYKKIRKLEDTAARSRGRLANSIECARLSNLRARGDHACSHQYHNGKPTSGISFRLRSPEVLQMEDDVVVRLSSKSMRFDGSRFFWGVVTAMATEDQEVPLA